MIWMLHIIGQRYQISGRDSRQYSLRLKKRGQEKATFTSKMDSEVVLLCISLASYLLIGQDQNSAEYVNLLFKYQQFILIRYSMACRRHVFQMYLHSIL